MAEIRAAAPPRAHRVRPTAYDDWLHFQLQLTYRCQLDCVYCGLDRSKPDMSEEMIVRGLDFCFGTAAPNVEIQLFGGEPLLRFDLMRFATARARALAAERGKRLVLGLATNGLLLDEARVAFIAEHDLDVVISLDGPVAVQARNRPLRATGDGAARGPYPIERVVAGFHRLVRAGVEPMINMVVGPEDVPDIAAGVAYVVEDLGATLVRVTHRLGVHWSQADRAAFFAALGAAIDRHGDRARFVNLCSPDEPALAATSVNLDGDGRIYLGCALTTTGDMPSLLDTSFVGDLATLPGVDAVDRDRAHQCDNLVSSPWLQDVDRELIRNNLEMGFEAVAFSRAYIARNKGRLDLEALGCDDRGDVVGHDGEEGVAPASPEEILACLPEPEPTRLAVARAEAVPGGLTYDFGRDAAEVALIAGAAPAAVVEGDPERIAARYA
ncbi:MAG: radical SAM protein, partial [Deltaproteobacteria bacterium]